MDSVTSLISHFPSATCQLAFEEIPDQRELMMSEAVVPLPQALAHSLQDQLVLLALDVFLLCRLEQKVFVSGRKQNELICKYHNQAMTVKPRLGQKKTFLSSYINWNL